MVEDPKRVMADTLTSVLEGMAFTFAESPEDEGLTTDETEFIHATIEFRGPASGMLGLAVPSSLCAELTTGVLGEEPGEATSPTNLCDTLGELLNVTCGNFTTALYGDQPVFDQSIPRVAKIDQSAWGILRDHPETVGFLVDGAPLLAQLIIQEKRG